MPARKFQELLEALPPEPQSRIEKRFRHSLEAMPLDQNLRGVEMTQFGEILGVNCAISKIEHRSDICISTLADYVEAMGGRLEIRAVFRIVRRITQFEKLVG